MAVFYILVRTFPFWAIPIGVAFLIDYFRPPKGRVRRKGAWLTLVVGMVLILASAAFLIFEGHKTAVPYLYEWLQSPMPAGL